MRTNLVVAAVPIFAALAASCSTSGPRVTFEEPSSDVANPGGGPQPSFGPVVQQPEPPPPISGGTLAMAPDQTTAVAADSDRDRIYVVDLPTRSLRHTIQLPRRSEPGRVTVDDEGRAHVALRRAGGIATVDLGTGALTFRDACGTPRGVAFDKARAMIHVACASGELVSLPLRGGAARTREVARDLRDVVVDKNGVLVLTTFRDASEIRLSDAGGKQVRPNDGSNVAWRAVAAPDPDCQGCDDETAIVAQEPVTEAVSPQPGGYGGASVSGGCAQPTGIVTTRLKVGKGSVRLSEAVLPVDLATNGREIAVVAAGNAFTPDLPQIFVVHRSVVRRSSPNGDFGGCTPMIRGQVPGQAVAVVFDGADELVVQTREPAALHIMAADRKRPWKTISLATDSVADTGHAIFHSNAGGFIACASCHAEGSDDGHTWTFVGMGPRRTPSLLGTTPGTEPFHWDGEMRDLRDIVDHVFVERMSGPKIDEPQFGALGDWMFSLPAPPRLRAEDEVTARGAVLFQQRCASCHAGPLLTNNASVDVGTGGAFQVPSLVGLGWRAPFLHTGCAKTLFDRFDPACGGAQHGEVKDLSKAQIQDLVEFLETL
ncbi:MAG: c-type cytochrome [Labilithrix sp.]|nr:c-type cytochrome [Labilithrix sp.]